ncbi:hypothetical protein, conserved, partial [Eimeria necatrix]
PGGVEEFLWGAFGEWGDLESVRVVGAKGFGFVTFAYRVQAEFAKLAMADQPFPPFAPLLTVKWAHQEAPKRALAFPEGPRKLRAPRGPPEDPQLAAQALHSYCAAWQNYWAHAQQQQQEQQEQALQQQQVLLQQQQVLLQQQQVLQQQQQQQGGEGEAAGEEWPQEDPETAHANVERLMNVLSRVEGLSTSDFLNAGPRGVQTPQP